LVFGLVMANEIVPRRNVNMDKLNTRTKYPSKRVIAVIRLSIVQEKFLSMVRFQR
jgi:hypothetical protein